MKVLSFVPSLSRSGGGVYSAAAGLAGALTDLGVEVVAVGGKGQHFEEDREAWGGATLDPYGTGEPGYGLHRHAWTALRRHRPDLVHVHGIWSANAIWGLGAALDGVPAVVSPHGMLAPNVLSRRARVKRVHATLFERPLLSRAYVHALNEPERVDVSTFLPGAESRTFVLPNGVPPAASPTTPAERRGAIFLGRLHPVKQVKELVGAWRALGLSDEETLTIAGWGGPEYEAEVRETAGAAANISFAGSLYGEAKSSALSRARFFILPSLREGLPMAVLEAIQHGCIPIITPECSLPELLRDGIALPMEKDFSDFQAVMQRALGFSDHELATRSRAATDYAGNYAWPNIAREMIGQFQRCIDDARP